MLGEPSEQARLADQPDYDSISFTEHHFHWRASTGACPIPETREPPELLGDGLALVGTVDTVTRQLEALLERLPARWLFHWTYNGLIPHAKLMRSLELFATRVMPRFCHE